MTSSSSRLISVVLPVYNERLALDTLTDAIRQTLSRLCYDFEIVYVNDGSSDGSGDYLDQLAGKFDEVCVVHLAKNCGHQAAVQAGLNQARGAAIILMDSDLQDEPTALPLFIAQWEQGFDVVYAIRTERKEQAWKRFLFTSFYRVLNAVSSVEIPNDAGNFSLIDRRVLDVLNELPERDRYFPGLRSWVGFRQIGIPVERAARYDDHPRVSLRGLFNLAKTALISFSNIPLTMFYLIGALSFLACGSLGCYALFQKLITGTAVPGWTSTTIVVSFFGAINALGIAILGEYAARIYDQVRARPNFLISRVTGLASLPHETDLSHEIGLRDNGPEAELLNWVSENLVSETFSTSGLSTDPV